MKKQFLFFSLSEWLLWGISCGALLLSAVVFGRVEPLRLAVSVLGVTSLIFNAKGNPVGQLLMIVFSVAYGVISFSVGYYGEMITYLGMTAPMALFALVSWLRHPYKGNHAQVKVNVLRRREVIFMFVLAFAVTAAFGFLLSALHTSRLFFSTLSVTTSFLAVYLTFRRSACFPLAYAANDLVLIVLWGMATAEDHSYASVLVCFSVFFFNDMYGFYRWKKMKHRQTEEKNEAGA